jgi:hypothetical protein
VHHFIPFPIFLKINMLRLSFFSVCHIIPLAILSLHFRCFSSVKRA